MMAKLFKCYIEIEDWGTVSEDMVEFIFSDSQEEAKYQYITRNRFRRNKKGLTVTEIPIVYAQRIKKTTTDIVTESVWNSFMQHSYPESSYQKRIHYFCEKCNKEIGRHQEMCPHCGALMLSIVEVH